MTWVARVTTGAAVLAAVMTTGWAVPSAASQPGDGAGPRLAVSGSAFERAEQVRLGLTVTNASGAACGLSKVADGTVLITSVRKDGQDLLPVLARSFYLDGIGNAIAPGMTAVEPGATIDVALRGIRIHDGADPGSVVLRSVAATPDGGGLDSLWPIGAPGKYQVTAGYAVPALDGALTACAGAAASQTAEFTVGEPEKASSLLWVPAGALLLAVIVLVIVLLVRRRRRAAGAVVMALLAVVAAIGGAPAPARADYEIDPNSGIPVEGVDFQSAVDGCLAQFGAPGGDPAGILNRLKDKKTPKVRIIPTTGESGSFETPESKDGKGSSTVTWNPTSTQPYGDGVPRDPCAALYHELNHSDDISRDAVPQGECADTGIKTAEVKATLAENKYRKAKKLPERTEYQGKKLPKNLDACKQPKKKEPPAKGPIKLCEGTTGGQCGSTNGDPHLVTFDRAYYDFQAVGEFIVTRSTSEDPLEVQARQAPLGTSKTVSVNSAVAFRIGTSKVELKLTGGVTQIRIDGAPAAMPRGEKTLPGGGTLTRRESDIGAEDGYDLRWPDGSGAAVDPIGSYGYRLLLKLAAGRAGKVRGLLGDFDGDPANDLAPRDGAPLAQPVPFERLYPSYADSWRVAQDNSLFHYDAGQNTTTFTDRGYPEKPMTVADLDPARRAQAEEICRWAGVTDAWQFTECVLDVGVTGRPEFAVAGASTELVAPPAAAPIAATPIASGTLSIGGTDRLSFDAQAGQAVFVDATATTLPDECSPLRLLDPAGKDIASGCNINGRGHIDRTELVTGGRYTVLLAPRDGAIGRATVRVYVAEDFSGTLEPNGASASVTLTQPGAVARYRFNGVAGQRVFLHVAESTLDDQCSPLLLLGPSATVLNSGCVINGVGHIDGTVLPANGSYTVLIEPKDRTTGSVQSRLFMAGDGEGTITVGGSPVVATIPQPGFIMRYRFNGVAGTQVTVTATGATGLDQCSPLILLDPSGKLLDSGCIINGVGDIKRTTLPVSGVYTLVVDPAEARTGTVTLSLQP